MLQESNVVVKRIKGLKSKGPSRITAGTHPQPISMPSDEELLSVTKKEIKSYLQKTAITRIISKRITDVFKEAIYGNIENGEYVSDVVINSKTFSALKYYIPKTVVEYITEKEKINLGLRAILYGARVWVDDEDVDQYIYRFKVNCKDLKNRFPDIARAKKFLSIKD
jgi:hypothetical protein